jgi:hypothetical protein
MKTRVLPSILVAASVFTINSQPQPPVDWERVGENWGNSFQHTKDGIKRIVGQTIDKDLRLYGHSLLEDVIALKNLTCYGYAELQGTKVQGVTTMYGPMEAKDSTFKDLDVRCYNEMIGKGTVTLNDCAIQNLTLNGALKATRTTFHQIVTFAADTLLTDSTVHELMVMNALLPRQEKAVVILDNAIVEGSITFSQKGGIVICKGTSEVRGPIENGTLKKE